MSVLIQLNHEGYKMLVEDRISIQTKIKNLENELQRLKEMYSEFDYAYERLKGFYEPEIKIKTNINKETGKPFYYLNFEVHLPNSDEKKKFRMKVCEVAKYPDMDSIKFKKMVNDMVREELLKTFPIYY